MSKVEFKKIHNLVWRFEFMESGYVKIATKSVNTVKKKEVEKWMMHLHGVDVESCLQYIFAYNNGKVQYLTYDQLESA